jgi:hypothetical protein
MMSGARLVRRSMRPTQVTVFMVQHAGFGGEQGRRVIPTFLDAVNRQFRVK